MPRLSSSGGDSPDVTDLLVIGASGLLGEQLLAEAKRRGHDAVGTYAGDPVNGLIPLNLSDLVAAVTLVRDRRPKTVLLPAAMTGVDACESHPDQAQLVNADAPREIAKACHTLGIRLVFFSTDYVFDGRRGPFNERRRPQPLNVYGRTKLAGERRRPGPRSTCWTGARPGSSTSPRDCTPPGSRWASRSVMCSALRKDS
ncbi:MAG: sugar nucleotide-binding protein [Methanobacteriota archaeon]|nr:MAG: sugar nucleotide-binding protein [Euryarchaeota archaeon]